MVGNLLGKRVYVDSSIFIYAVEVPHLYPRLVSELLMPMFRGDITVVTSWVTFAEVLTKPIELQDQPLQSAYELLISPSDHFEVWPVEENVSKHAAKLRSDYKFKLPDAIHLATGDVAKCNVFLTGDEAWKRSGFPIVIPADL